MSEQIQHVRPHENTRAIPIGSLLLEDGPSVDRRAERLAEGTIHRVLAMRDHPGEAELARITNDLLTYCTVLANGLDTVPDGDLCTRGQAALVAWDQLRTDGPADGPLGTWSYPRHLAHCARDMMTAIREYRQNAASAARFIGRTVLPPVATDTP
ncbi:hypothetical protein HHL19_06410 [Streptomyces sp. R302]|uniref:hypothetical protein n=1 Tax=unclassified Streptomyces TaxID=2593676 RepID=UPI00145D7EA9|nr:MULTISPECIES: hypothetical protein [unclassified Streptomyces]NML53350.1 hypothetical protein [Streptomyces sp. R301]NML78304.1 hypothetical protein [Streptomyces sp. R302]